MIVDNSISLNGHRSPETVFRSQSSSMAFEAQHPSSAPSEQRYSPSLALLDAMVQSTGATAPAVFEQMVAELGPVHAKEQALLFCSSPVDGEAWKTTLREWEEREAQKRVASATAQPAQRQSWTWDNPDLSLLPDENTAAPPFPVEIFGDFWAEWCRVTAQNAGAPVEFVAGTLLATVGAMLGNVRWPMAGDDWTHPSILWVALIGLPSAAKTPAMRPVEDLVKVIYQRRRAAFKLEASKRVRDSLIRGFLSDEYQRALKQQTVDHWRLTQSLPDNLPLPPKETEALPEIVAPSLFFKDVTVEGILGHVAGLPRGALLRTAELSTWFGSFDRYAGGRHGGDRGFWNSAFDGGDHELARKGQDQRGAIRAQTEIPRLSIGVLGGTHPKKIKDLLAREGCDDDDGLAHRFLWVWGDPLDKQALAARKSGAVADNGRALDALSRIDALCQTSENGPIYVKATLDAEQALRSFKAWIADECVGKSDWRQSSLGKASGLALRISNVLAHLRWSSTTIKASPAHIMPEVMTDAVRFMRDYALPNAERLEHVVTPGEIEGDARALMSLILEKGWRRFHTTDIKRYGPARIKIPLQRNDALDVLEKACLIKRDFQREGDTKGRQREEYDVNPIVLRPAGT